MDFDGLLLPSNQKQVFILSVTNQLFKELSNSKNPSLDWSFWIVKVSNNYCFTWKCRVWFFDLSERPDWSSPARTDNVCYIRKSESRPEPEVVQTLCKETCDRSSMDSRSFQFWDHTRLFIYESKELVFFDNWARQHKREQSVKHLKTFPFPLQDSENICVEEVHTWAQGDGMAKGYISKPHNLGGEKKYLSKNRNF